MQPPAGERVYGSNPKPLNPACPSRQQTCTKGCTLRHHGLPSTQELVSPAEPLLQQGAACGVSGTPVGS
jgi:hypothetical protein